MPEIPPPDFRPGDPWTAAALNQILRELAALRAVRGGAGLAARRGAGGELQVSGTAEVTDYPGVATGAISPRSGTTPGSGTVTPVWIDGTGAIAQLSYTIDVKNASATTMTGSNGIDDGKYVWIRKDVFGTWWVSPLEC